MEDFLNDICELIDIRSDFGVPKSDTVDLQKSKFIAKLKDGAYKNIPRTIEWDINDFWITKIKQVFSENTDTTNKYAKIPNYTGGYIFYKKLLEKPHSTDQELRDSIQEIKDEYNKTKFNVDGDVDNRKFIQEFFNDTQDNRDSVDCEIVVECYKFIIKITHPTLESGYLCLRLDNSAVYMSSDGKEKYNVDIDISVIKKLSYRFIYFNDMFSCFLLIPQNNISKICLWMTLQNTNKSSESTDLATLSCISHTSLDSEKSEQAEQAEQSEQSAQADLADTAYSSTIADDLTEDGVTRLIDRLATDIVTTRQDILDNIEKKIAEKQLERELRYDMSVYSGEFNTLNIYKDSDINDALEILNNTGRLLITGGTGDGKTELAYLLANKLTGEAVGKPLTDQDNNCYNRVCIVSARNGYSLTNSKKTGIIDKFIKHIIDNNIQDNCVLICNEVQASDMGYLLGDSLWENFNDSKQTSLLPSNLKLIFTGCKNRDFGIDSQITERIKHIELSYLSANGNEVNHKLITLLKTERPDIEKILKLVETINDNEEYGVITLRKLFDIVRYDKLELNVDIDMLSSNSIRAKDKLELLIGSGDEG